MARSNTATSKLETHRRYLEGVAKKMADELWGPNGPAWGTTMTELEDVALEARAIFAKKLVELGLERQAAAAERPAELTACPDCHRPFGEPEAPVPRAMETRAGDLEWEEPQEYCRRCRRSFFPSEQESGGRSDLV
jgi:cytochrome c553